MNGKGHGKLALLLAGAFLWNLPTGSCMDLSLQDAINTALTQNTGLAITRQDEAAAAASLAQAKGNNGWQVTASDTLSTLKKEGNDREDSNSVKLRGSLPIFNGGANKNTIKQNEFGVKKAELSTGRSQEDLKLDVIKAYYNALEARKTIDVNQESVDNYTAHYTNVQQLFSAGSTAKIDVLRSSVELSNARQTLIKSQNAYEVDLATLRNLLNIDRSEPLNLTSDFSYDQFAIPLEDCITYAFGHRRDLLADQYTLDQKELGVKIAKAGYQPDVSFSAGPSHSNTFNPSSDSSNGVDAGFSVSWNVFDSGVTKAKVKAAEVELETARLQLQKDQENVDLEIRQAYYNMREAEKRLNSTSDAVGQAEEDYFIAREKYRAGEGIMLDVIDAQLALSTAKLNYISAEYDYARYKAEVENGMGISLSDLEKQAAGEEAVLHYEMSKRAAEDASDMTEVTQTSNSDAMQAADEAVQKSEQEARRAAAEAASAKVASEMAQSR